LKITGLSTSPSPGKYIFPISLIKNIYQSKIKKLDYASFFKAFQPLLNNLIFYTLFR